MIFRFTTTNDAFLSGDKYRTAAAEIAIGDVSLGMNLYTTAPPEIEHRNLEGGNKNYISPIWGPNKGKKYTYSRGSRVYAGLYLGYKSVNTVSRVGVDAPWVQDFFQNGIHRYLVGSPYFNTNYGPPTRLFEQNISYNPWSLY